ncbi:ATP-dependent protease La Type I [Olavius algarvensis spirochete endosymbiont]|uniref:endopeptidase La n=1 Tax=Olavius algarvensis spirochete endosymbiont TaxID=260710 RepID=UPI000F26D9F4|nr:endopeptidase La [Olavius algarvensis spirochete endosymbiont]VDA99085.1 ATP-dependent protease La Type I [Olavius algarvensis spirochete endosymbiont]
MPERNEKPNQIIAATDVLPEYIYLVPLQGKPIFPGIFTPIMISGAEDIAVINKAINNHKVIGLVLTNNPEASSPGPSELYKVGTVAKIVKRINLPDGGINIFISTLRRFRISRFQNETSPLSAAVQYLNDMYDPKDIELKALTRALLSEMKQISEDNPLFTEEIRLNMVNIDDPGKIADFITSILNVARNKQQKILETLDVKKRLGMVLVHIKKEHELSKIQKKIAGEINEKIEKNQRDYFLREELKAIKKELGEPTDARSSEYQKFKEALAKFDFTGEIAEQVERELDKFQVMDSQSSEYIVTRNYLDWIVSLPWEVPGADKTDIAASAKILEEDHYGLEDVKERIIEYLAVRKLKEDSKGSIILLVGPPGVGKTSIGKSIARAMGRPFFRFSVGGMRDEAEIKGHRRTYIGAMPGKIIQGLKIVKSRRPVFMIDEIDKLGMSFQGDPSSALLEVLDSEQNINFRDHYLDLPFDLSHVVFVVTANTLDTIPRPLMDRMEIIRLSGYVDEEKMQIAKQYIIPRSLQRHGLKRGQIRYNLSALKAIADGYARDAGMRTFEKAIDRIHRKVALGVIDKSKTLPIRIKREGLEHYLKKPVFRGNELSAAVKPGMALGLAWTSMGGSILVIEADAILGKAALNLTGQMGEVMKESAEIAYTRVRKIVQNIEGLDKFFSTRIVHLHIPEGAIPKDGPSAGITMTTALLSLATGQKTKSNMAMTGELSLTGRVLSIGGLKEKTIAARRHKIGHLIIPSGNQQDLEEIPDQVKKGIVFHPVSEYNEVVQLTLPQLKL